jgi:hypothetical protein
MHRVGVTFQLDTNPRANVIQAALLALWRPRFAYLSTVMDHSMGVQDPFALWQLSHQVLFNFHGVTGLGQAQSSRQPSDVRVHHYTRSDTKGRSQYDIGGFAADAGQLDERLDVARDFAIVPLDKFLTTGFDILGFIPKESRALDGSFQTRLRRSGEIRGRLVLFKQLFGDEVDALVRTLR